MMVVMGMGDPALVFGDMVESLDAEDLAETGLLECIQAAGSCSREGPGLRPIKEDGDQTCVEDAHLFGKNTSLLNS